MRRTQVHDLYILDSADRSVTNFPAPYEGTLAYEKDTGLTYVIIDNVWEQIGGGGGGGAVDSVFGRTGAVVAQANDYTWAQIDKTVSDLADLASRSHADLTDIGVNTHAQIDSHIASTSNPHGVTAAQANALAIASNLGDLADAAVARSNLGLAAGGAGDIWVEKAGDTMTGQLIIFSGGLDVTGSVSLDGDVVINESGADVDFRVEGDTDQNLLFADALNDVVGIGTAAPSTSAKLTVTGDGLLLASDVALPPTMFITPGGTIQVGGGGGSPSGALSVDVGVAGTIDLDGAVTINDSGADLDFRVESSGNANMLVVNAGLNTVGIGVLNPEYMLDVFGDIRTGTSLHVASNIYHRDDTDTFIAFSTDQIDLRAGNNYGVRVATSEISINEAGADIDFRVEGDAEPNLIFVDAGNDRVGIGTGTPSYKLDVTGDAYVSSDLFVASQLGVGGVTSVPSWAAGTTVVEIAGSTPRLLFTNTRETAGGIPIPMMTASVSNSTGDAFLIEIGALADGADNSFTYLFIGDAFNDNAIRVYPTKKTAFYNNIIPGNDNSYDVGEIGSRWDDIYATNGTIQTSDKNEKRDVEDSDLGLAFINNLRPVRYLWKDTIIEEDEVDIGADANGNAEPQKEKRVHIKRHTRPHYGLIAQDVKGVMDKMGISDFAGYVHGEGTYGLRYNEFVAPMIAAIQELTAKVERLESGKRQQ